MTSPSRSVLSPSLKRDADAFELSPDTLHLNHGSYGAVPRAVRLEQQRLRAAIERNPTGYFHEEFPGAMREMAGRVARRFGGHGDEWVFCENATAAVSGILHSLPLASGDEILTTSHAYGAVLKAMSLVAQRRGAILRVAGLPPLLQHDDEAVNAIGRSLGPRTRLLVIDHITSATATILPVQRIVELAHANEVPVLIDGAHAPGQIALDVPAIGADWYTGNAHKWMFAPRGCGLLWTTPARQESTRPAVLSHGTEQNYTAAFDWIGTRDPTPWLSFETAARVHDDFGGADLMARNRALAAEGARMIAEELRFSVAGTPGTRAAMAAFIIDEHGGPPERADALRRKLSADHRIMVPVSLFEGRLWLRISAQIYNGPEDYERLIEACRALFPHRARVDI
ncbi:MAG TPA: aminotransferase class V-fold PLP-dependent enzyme [Rhizomicrobium sp.]|jgi:isopenicillin-N epimerase